MIGLGVPAVLWLCTGLIAIVFARRGDRRRHSEWMLRNYALTFSAVTSRAVVPLVMLMQRSLPGSKAGLDEAIQVGQWLGWMINFVVVEALFRRRRRR